MKGDVLYKNKGTTKKSNYTIYFSGLFTFSSVRFWDSGHRQAVVHCDIFIKKLSGT